MKDAGFAEDVAYDMLYNQVDPGMRARYGLGPRRMEPSFVETYDRLCELHGVTRDPELGERCAALGRGVYGPPPAFEGALEALHRLTQHLPTVVYTQGGDMEYQLECVRGAGVIEIVREDRVRVCPRKDADMFLHTLSLYGVEDPSRAWMVGNSMRSDIN